MFKEGNIVETISMEDTELRPWWEMDWATRTPLNGNGVSYQAYYSEVGKAHYTGKDLTEVRSLQRKLVPGQCRAGTIRANLTAGNSN